MKEKYSTPCSGNAQNHKHNNAILGRKTTCSNTPHNCIWAVKNEFGIQRVEPAKLKDFLRKRKTAHHTVAKANFSSRNYQEFDV